METFLTVLACLLAVILAARFAFLAGKMNAPGTQPATEDPQADPPTAPEPDAPKDLHHMASELGELWQKAPTPAAARGAEAWREAVAAVAAMEHGDDELLGFARRGEDLVPALALEALARRGRLDSGHLRDALIQRIEQASGILREQAFALLEETSPAPLVPPVMGMLHRNLYAWDDAEAAEALRGFLERRRAAGEVLSFGSPTPGISAWDRSNFEDIFRRLPDELVKPLRLEIGLGDGAAEHREFLAGFARVLDPVDGLLEDGSPLVETPKLAEITSQLHGMLTAGTLRCPLLVGEEGSGKSALVRLVVQRLQKDGFTVFEASGPDLVSGQCYLGDLEKRVRGMIQALEKGKFVWLVPALSELVEAGRTRASEIGVLDMVLPHLQRGSIRMIAEVRPGVLDKLLGEVPRLAGAMAAVRVAGTGDSEAKTLAGNWLAKHQGERKTRLTATPAQLDEALKLATQYFPAPALPGRLFQLVRGAFQHATRGGGGTRALDGALLLESIAATTGMPIELLDEAKPFDLEAVRQCFGTSVMGQPEAVDALVARLAMIKAGLTDPTRPLGVFLFAGPTGTGKTELAKCLARYLFGSEQRMLRVDMSELQAGKLERLTAAPTRGGSGSLASRIRHQPFSVVLLDEFEKADPAAWDLFLQVFDDGRLTDDAGNVADFRQSILILTSNLGARVAQGVPLGFGAGAAEEFRVEEIEKAIAAAFRPEFVNRIDRVLCFRPLSRDTMRQILSAELRKALGRRGLRQRPWVLEFDATASDFLLEKGFSPTLGARPLQRAIDRHLLGPMAEAVVGGDLPAAEDLVFIYARDGRLQWDLASGQSPASEPESGELPTLSLRQMALGPAGSREEIEALRQRLDDLAGLIELDAFHQRRTEIFARMGEDGFWSCPDRFAVLGDAEYLDRIESATNAARETIGRLATQPEGSAATRALVAKIALRVHLLESAWPDVKEGKRSAAWIGLQLLEDTPKAAAFAKSLTRMIESWAEERGMKNEPLVLEGWERAWAVEGFAALRILELENGLHVGEEGGLGETARVRIAVAAQPPEPESLLPEPVAVLAARALDAAASDEVVRRYQELPTPLVRDRRREFRTGRLDLVLAGHFDLLKGA